MLLFILAILLALSVSFMCSLLESSVLSLQRSDVASLRETNPEQGALWEHMKKHIDEPIAAILIINTSANTIGATVAGAQFARLSNRWGLGEWSLALFSVVFALLIIQWGEILPKSLGVRYRARVAAHAGPPLTTAIKLFKPIMWLTRKVNKPFEPRTANEGVSTVAEIQALVSYASFARLLDARQTRIITKTMELADLSVESVMVPRTRVAALPETASVSELLATVQRTGFSRFPVYRGEIDNMQGIVLVKDVLIALNEGRLSSEDFASRSVTDFVSKPIFVPETASVADFMAETTNKETHMALIVDEYGGFAGLMTLEDALEEMVGEIVDEHDRARTDMVEKIGPRRWQAKGRCPIDELSEALGMDLTGPRGGYSTLSGLLMQLGGKIPAVGEVFSHQGLSFKILEASRTMPLKVEITARRRG